MIHIRPVSDLQNYFPEIESQVLQSGEPVFLTKNGYGSMVLLSIEQYAMLTGDIEAKLDEANFAAKTDKRRFTEQEVFGRLRERVDGYR